MPNFTWIWAAAVLLGILAIGPKPAAANPDWTKKERKQCNYCHVGAWDSGKYTEAGTYYKEHQYSFKGYTPKASDSKQTADSKQPAAASAPGKKADKN